MVVWAKLALVGVSFLCAGAVKYFWPNYKDDNAVEQVVEQVIKAETGMAVDLTPDSPEESKS